MMGEIDTKSICPVQVALHLFGEKGDHRRNRPFCNNDSEKERKIEGLLKDLNHYKSHLEEKETAYKQSLVRLDHQQKTADELFIILHNTEFERDIYMNECKEARMGIDELESNIEEMDEQLLESAEIRDELFHVMAELKGKQGELLHKEAELVAARDAKLEAMKQEELIETALNLEKEKTEELFRHVTELNDTIFNLQLDVMEAEKEKNAMLSDKEAELNLATNSVEETRKELESLRNQLKSMQKLEEEHMEKCLLIESLKLELHLKKEQHDAAEKAASDAINDINQLIADMELLVKENSDKGCHINLLEMELDQLKLELESTNKDISSLSRDFEAKTCIVVDIKRELAEKNDNERKAQVEIAVLNSELHEGRSKTAAAEAAAERAKHENSVLVLTIQQLESEVEAAKKEIQRLREEAEKDAKETQNSEVDKLKTEDKKHITISVEEYEALTKKADVQGQEPKLDNRFELEILKKELEIITVRLGEFRTRAEQAAFRAETAERGKAILEEQIRRWKEQMEKRKAAAAAAAYEESIISEVSISRKMSSKQVVQPPKVYQPLSKVLKMKF